MVCGIVNLQIPGIHSFMVLCAASILMCYQYFSRWAETYISTTTRFPVKIYLYKSYESNEDLYEDFLHEVREDS